MGCDVKVEGARETLDMVNAAGGEMVSLQPLDLTEESEVERLIAHAVDTFGDFDILYNSAALARGAPR